MLPGEEEGEDNYKAELVDYLREKKIKTMIFAGINGGACVKESMQGALNSNCNAIAYGNAIADLNYKDFIYPYVGRYSNIETECKDCAVKEAATIDEVTNYMISDKGETSHFED